MAFSPLLEELLARQNLTDDKITYLISETMHGRLTPVQIAAWLMALRMKGETPGEIAACARLMREIATPIERSELPPLFIDTCGTGGDRSHLINISTLVGLTLAAQGIPVAKHGNRAVSSSSGSADVLEALGYPLEEKPELIAARLKKNNFAFFFAPLYHPAMKHAGPVRKEIGVRTVFNVLGPLANPAAAPLQLIGVYAQALILPMAETLKLLGLKAALVVHSEDGLDEISPIARTNYALLLNGKITQGTYTPPQQQYVPALDALRADSKEKSLALFKDVVAGQNAAGAYMTALNAAFAKKLFDAVKAGTPLADPAPTQDEIVAQFDLIQSGALGDVVKFT
ncbi:MAG: anthranilate phosphoribosyltransferase [Spirochaetes bacterium]|nr:anthranilate phosphoribosyltransferase [Spirochaetota bacterium]MBX3721771.1 anthranilate phosphoribosyltransferase [Turneriella sp.]